MKVLEVAVPLIPGAMIVALSGCGGGATGCSFTVPQEAIKQGARLKSVSCDLSTTCCKGLQDVVQLVEDKNKLDAKGRGMAESEKKIQQDLEASKKIQQDLVGTCGRADQVAMYNCLVDTLPKMAPAKAEKQMKAKIKAKGCHNVAVKTGTDGSGTCSFTGKGMKVEFEVSTGCCTAVKSLAAAGKGNDLQASDEQHMGLLESACGMIGACGKTDQQHIMKFAKKKYQELMGKGKGKGPQGGGELELLEMFNQTDGGAQQMGKGKGGGELELLEMFNQTDGGAQQMMATLMTIATKDDVAEDDVAEDDGTEDDGTEDGSQMVTGLLGFVAGATVTGLGVAALRRRPSSQDEYNEIVA